MSITKTLYPDQKCCFCYSVLMGWRLSAICHRFEPDRSDNDYNININKYIIIIVFNYSCKHYNGNGNTYYYHIILITRLLTCTYFI